jgi:hypothetical protein
LFQLAAAVALIGAGADYLQPAVWWRLLVVPFALALPVFAAHALRRSGRAGRLRRGGGYVIVVLLSLWALKWVAVGSPGPAPR